MTPFRPSQAFGIPANGLTLIETETPPTRAWPSPIREDARVGLAGDFVGLVAPQSEADASALLVQFLVAFGSALGHSAHFMTERDRQTANLFAVVVGESAGARKGTGKGHVSGLIARADPTVRESSGLASGEGVIYHVRDAVEGIDKKTTERVVIDPGVSDKRLAIYEPEFAAVLKVCNREGNTTSTVLRSAWENGDLQTMTKNSPLRATGAHVSAICHITRDELVRLLTLTESANGFANRFLYCLSKRSKMLPDGGAVDEAAIEQLARQTGALLARGKEWGALRRDDAARLIWHREYERLTTPPAGLLGCMIARAAPITMRLALIFAASDPDNNYAAIGADHLNAALAVWDYAEASCRFIFGDKLGDDTADTILTALRASPDGMTRTEISDLLKRHATSGDISRALSMIAMRGLAMRFTEPTSGRPIE